MFIFSVMGLLKKSNYLTNALLWIIIINFHTYLYSTLTAGDNLLNQLLLFNIFFSSKTYPQKTMSDITTVLHNTALIGIKTQVCLAYFLAALFKINDPSWLDGTAIAQIATIPEYSNSFLSTLPAFICAALTYLTVLYQLTFPITIFITPLKKYVFTFGFLQHLLIALTMGLFSFGVVMMICYILFLKYDTTTLPTTSHK